MVPLADWGQSMREDCLVWPVMRLCYFRSKVGSAVTFPFLHEVVVFILYFRNAIPGTANHSRSYTTTDLLARSYSADGEESPLSKSHCVSPDLRASPLGAMNLFYHPTIAPVRRYLLQLSESATLPSQHLDIREYWQPAVCVRSL